MNKIQAMIEEIPALSEVQKQFYTMIIRYRYEKVLLPLWQRITEKELDFSEEIGEWER